jgi:predicted Zn-dependent protease
MILGDLALRRRDTAGGRRQYAASLSLIQSAHDQSPRAKTVTANLLHRLGRDNEAMQLYESQLAAQPHDRNLRADYVAMLMERGDVQRARLVLSSR